MNRSQKKSFEIDIRELFWRLLSQWKAILLVSVLAAILVCTAKHAKDMHTYRQAAEEEKAAKAQTKLSAEERESNIVEALSEEDRSVVTYILHEQEWLETQKEYLKESLLMHTDTKNQRTLSMIIVLDAENSEDLPAIIRNYNNYFNSEETAESVKPFIAPDADSKYITELLDSDEEESTDRVEISGRSAALRLCVILPEDADAEEIEKAVRNVIGDYSSELGEEYPHTIDFTGSEIIYRYDSKNDSKKTNLLNTISMLERLVKDGQGALTETQAAALESIKAIRSTDGAVTGVTETGDEQDTSGLSRPGYSKKYALIGFVLGMLAYIIAYILIIIIRGRVNSAADVENYTGVRMIGEIYRKTEKRGIQLLTCSQLVNRIRYRNKDDENRQIERMLSMMEAVCSHEKVNDLTLINLAGASDYSDSIADRIIKAGNEKGVEIKLMNAAEDCNETAMPETDKAVTLVSDKTKADRLCSVVDTCRRFDISLLGNIFVSRI